MTDSTASLPPGVADRWGIEVVPLEVAVDGATHHEGFDLTPAELLAALRAGRRVTTSQPAPAAFARAYARAVERGAREIVSVHVSGELSGTVRAAELAALAARVPVHLVDSRTVAMGLGFAAVAAAEASSDADADGAAAAERARSIAASATTLFLVDSLEQLRRGGRIGPAAAAMGTVLGMRPLLAVRSGRIEIVDKVRTRASARERLESVAVQDAARRAGVQIVVHHLGQPELAAALARRLEASVGESVGDVAVSEISAVVAVHAGPGLLAVVVADR